MRVGVVVLISAVWFNLPTSVQAQHALAPQPTTVGAVSTVAIRSAGVSAQAEGWSRKGKFWLHANLGPGYSSMSAEDVKVSGVAGVGGVALGAFVSDNIVLFGDVIVNVLSGPTFKIGGQEYQTSNDITVTAGGVGAGLGYVTPSGFVMEVSAAVSYMTFEAQSSGGTLKASTNPGVGGRIGIGKDWLVSRKIALGVVGHGYVGVMKDKGANAPTWTAYGVGVTFSFIWVPKGMRAPHP